MRKIAGLLLWVMLPAYGQTQLSVYQPGVTPEGAVYFLPKTAIQVTVQVEKTVYTPGDFCKYADRFLRLKDVAQEPSESYRITSVRQTAVAVADTSKCYAVKFDARTVASDIALSDDGVLLAINAVPRRQAEPKAFVAAPKPVMVNPRQYMSEEILAAGSVAKQAELTAQDIYDLRESRNLLVRGQADYMPKDGAQLKLMLSELEQQDRAMTSLFAGVTTRDTTEYQLVYVPEKEGQAMLFRFSSHFGMVDLDDLSGTPYYIKIQNVSNLPAAAPVPAKKKNKQEQGIYVNVPGKIKSAIADARQTLVSNEFPAGQFGYVELLSGALFNKRFTTHLWLHPVSGAMEKLEAEQPK